MKNTIGTYLLLFFTLITYNSYASSSYVESINFQGVDRLYRVHNIEAAKNKQVPLVVHLHGYRHSSEVKEDKKTLDYIAWKPLHKSAEKNDFIVIQPAAYLGQWGLFSGLPNTTISNDQEVDDIGFILRIVDIFIQSGKVDKDRIYLTGISDGATMAYKLTCLLDSPFSAVVPIVGTMSEHDLANCKSEKAIPIMVIASTTDPILPYDGWIFPYGRTVSTPEIMNHFRLIHGCTGQRVEFVEDINQDDHSKVVAMFWTGCAKKNAVKLLRVEGGGHAVPSFTPVSESWKKKAHGHNQDIESAEEAWQFLKLF